MSGHDERLCAFVTESKLSEGRGLNPTSDQSTTVAHLLGGFTKTGLETSQTVGSW